MTRLGKVKSAWELEKLVKDVGFLPFFDSCVDGFSVSALTDNEWWTGEETDPWGWRVTLASGHDILYGKCMNRKAGFISREWLPLFVNARRDGYDFDARWDEGLSSKCCRDVMEYVERQGGALTSDIKRAIGRKGFEGASVLLQMQLYLFIDGFGHKRDRFGQEYGWSVGRLNTVENGFGTDYVTQAYSEAPKESFARIIKHARTLCPDADEEALIRVLQ